MADGAAEAALLLGPSTSVRTHVDRCDTDDKPSTAALLGRAVTLVMLVGPAVVAALLAATIERVRHGRAGVERELARRVVALLERLGPTYIKAGQILGTRRDLLPEPLCDQLSRLHDSARPLSPPEARAALEAVYGPELLTLFAEIDERPLASGSVACVYRARLGDGRDVVVKLQRPAIRATMAADLGLLRMVGRLLGALPPLRGTPVREVLDQICYAILLQLDFALEAASLNRLRQNLSAVPRVWVPRLDESASRDRTVVMEYIPDLDVGTARSSSIATRKRLAATTLGAVYRMLFVDGFVHCDLHPGNLYFTRHTQVVILDAGFSVQLSDRMRRLFAEFFLNMSLGRGQRCAEIVLESATGSVTPSNRQGFSVHLAGLVERSVGRPAREFSLIRFAAELFELQRRFGLRAAPELVFPLLALLVIETTVRDLDPDADFQQTAQPALMQGLFGSAA